jgi:hypothetical protein
VLSSVVKDRPLMRVKDLPAYGRPSSCGGASLDCGAVSGRVRDARLHRPPRRPAAGGVTERLRDKMATAIAGNSRPVADVAAEHGVSSPTAHKALGAAAARWLPEPTAALESTRPASGRSAGFSTGSPGEAPTRG